MPLFLQTLKMKDLLGPVRERCILDGQARQRAFRLHNNSEHVCVNARNMWSSVLNTMKIRSKAAVGEETEALPLCVRLVMLVI